MTIEAAAPEFLPVPVTAHELIVRWAMRDAEYANQRLEPQTIQSIREARMREASNLPNVSERARMYARAQTWVAPTSQQFGTLRDWLDE